MGVLLKERQVPSPTLHTLYTTLAPPYTLYSSKPATLRTTVPEMAIGAGATQPTFEVGSRRRDRASRVDVNGTVLPQNPGRRGLYCR